MLTREFGCWVSRKLRPKTLETKISKTVKEKSLFEVCLFDDVKRR